MRDINSDRLPRGLIKLKRQYHNLLPPLCPKIAPAGNIKDIVIATRRPVLRDGELAY